MKKAVFSILLSGMLLAGCGTTSSQVTSQPISEEKAPTTSSEENKTSGTSTKADDTIDAGATDTGKGGLNFGDVDWSEDLKKDALDTYLSGINGNHREMMQVATINNGKPQIASVEYYMDTTNHWFFGSSESDTGKIMDMKRDNDVALYWTRQLRASDMTMAPSYFNAYGVEVQGKANFYTAGQVNAMAETEKASVISIARGYYKSMGAQYARFYDSTNKNYMDDAAFVTYVFDSKSTTPYIIKPTKIVITSPYLLFVTRIDDATKDDGHYYAVSQGTMTLSEYTFLPKTFLDKLLTAVRTAKNDETLMKFTTLDYKTQQATGLKTQVSLTF